jgi:hypothetical protein
MGLVRTALIFGTGYVLGRPEGQAKVVELAQRPEVAQFAPAGGEHRLWRSEEGQEAGGQGHRQGHRQGL